MSVNLVPIYAEDSRRGYMFMPCNLTAMWLCGDGDQYVNGRNLHTKTAIIELLRCKRQRACHIHYC